MFVGSIFAQCNLTYKHKDLLRKGDNQLFFSFYCVDASIFETYVCQNLQFLNICMEIFKEHF